MKLRQMLLPAAALLISLQIAAQDLIYKKNGEIVKARILEATDASLSYKLYNPVDSLTHIINTQAVDSIIYRNGTKTSFKKVNIVAYQKPREQNTYNTHHLIGLDLSGYVFYGSLTLSYEYLPGKANWGYKVAFAKIVDRPKNLSYAFNFNMTPDWSTRLGINYYIFPVRTFRIGTGLYYIFGKYSIYNYYAYEPSESYGTSGDNRNMSGVVLSIFGFYNLNKHLAFNPGFDIPLIMSPTSNSFNTAFRCEILFNF